LSSKAENCARCKEKFEENDLKYFLEVPIEQQIRQFFKIEEFYQGIHYPFMRKKKVSENLEDFLDGTAYKSREEFFRQLGHLSLRFFVLFFF